MNITQFLDKHNACLDGRKRAKAFASLEDAWQDCAPEDLVWAATQPGVLTDRELRLFAVFCVRSVQDLMEDPRSIAAIDVAERHADGEQVVQTGYTRGTIAGLLERVRAAHVARAGKNL